MVHPKPGRIGAASWRPLLAGIALAAPALLLPPRAGAAEATAWSKGDHSEARLIDGGTLAGQRFAGLEIRLDRAFITYWRDPGDAGVPPTFDLAGSANLRSAEVRYPAPARLDEAGAAAFGYTDDVTFPIAVVPADPSKPVDLHVDVAYAVCHDICLPARARLSLALDGMPSAEASRVAAALAAVPRTARLGQTVDGLAVDGVAAAAGGDLSVAVTAPPGSSLFVEAPQPFAFEAGAPADGGDGRLTFPVKRLDGPAGGPSPPLTLTLVAPGDPRRAIAIETALDAATKTP